LRNTGQGVLLDAVTAYMNVLANQALVEAQRTNVMVLREIQATTKKRLDAGDVTPTDTAQAESRLSRGLADLNAAEVALAISKATYAQVIGDNPAQLSPAATVDRLSPTTPEAATETAYHDQGRGEQLAAHRGGAGECQPIHAIGFDAWHVRHRSGFDPGADQCTDL
jgi:outer membrane protein